MTNVLKNEILLLRRVEKIKLELNDREDFDLRVAFDEMQERGVIDGVSLKNFLQL